MEEAATRGVAERAFERGDQAGRRDGQGELDEGVGAVVRAEGIAQAGVILTGGDRAGVKVEIAELGGERGVVTGDHGAEQVSGNAVASSESDRDLGAGAAVFGERGGDPREVPGDGWEMAAMGAERRKQGEFDERAGGAVGDLAQVVERCAEVFFLLADGGVKERAEHGGRWCW